MIGERIDKYKLISELGRGGMGAVYLAERVDGEFRQTVAIKLIKRGMDTDLILKRFRRERQIVAALNHPNIAHFLAGGSTADGLPYFVMEYIDGKALYQYCEENKLSIEARLQIFRQICDAVETAHQNRIIHRDLKPSNILVKKNGMPKLLDFGIAKVFDPDLAVTEIDPTATAMRVMTPEYASPEQVTGGEIGEASDIYSLGIILYEMLTGHRPYKLKRQVPHEVARIICEETPSRPSAPNTNPEMRIPTLEYISQSGDPALDVQSSRFEELDKIVLKALRKNPAERYQSAAIFAEDVTNFLEHRPVKAEKFLPETRTKKIADKKSAAILPFKIIGADKTESTEDIFLGIGLADALISRLGGVQRLIVRPTSSVMRFSETEDSFAAGKELAVEYIVEGNIRRAGERIRITARLLNVGENTIVWSETFDEKFTDVLELEDSLSERIAKSLLPQLTGEEEKQLNKRGTNSAEAYEAYLRGRVNWSLQSKDGLARAIVHYQRAVELDPEYALAYAAIAEYYIFLGIHCVIPFEKGAIPAKQAAEKAVRLDPTLAEGYAALGFSVISFDLDWQQGRDIFKRALEINPHSLATRFWRAAMFAQTKQSNDALEELKILNELDPDSMVNKHMLGWVLYHARRYDESIGAHRQLLKIEPNYAWGLQSYSWALRRVGEFEGAVPAAERASQLTGDHPFYLTNLAATYAEAGEKAKAEEILARLLETAKSEFVSEYMLALVYCALGDKSEAFKNLEKSLATRDGWLNWLGVDPQFDILRDDPRYDDLMRRAGNPLAKPEEERAAPIANTGGEKSIAVLPLKFFGTPAGTGEEEFLGIGLADALITRLSNVRRLLVRPTSSVLPFADSPASPFQAGRELKVNYVLEGSVRRVGERIRVTVQLLNIADNSSRWAESFSEHLTDVLELEDSISERVVKSLLPKLTGEEEKQLNKRGTNSAEAYEAYLRGRFHWNRFTPESLVKAREAFETAIKIDSAYALAYVGMTDVHIWSNIYGMMPSAEAVLSAQNYALKAIELDENSGEAYASLGLSYQNRFSWEKAYEYYRQALDLAPNYVHAHEWLSASLIGHGETEKGVEEIKTAERLDPLSLRTKTMTAWALYQAHHFEEALERARYIIETDANYPQGYAQIGNNLFALGRADEALEYFEKFDRMIPGLALAKYQLCFAYNAVGRKLEAERALEEIKALAAAAYVKPFFLGMANSALGRLDEAFAYFEQAADESEPWMLWFGTEPMLEKLHYDERFLRLLEKMNNPLAAKFKAVAAAPSSSNTPITDSAKRSIAVLPLTLTGAETEDDNYLCLGLADALIIRLSNVRRLIVRPTSSILRFGQETFDSFAAGRELSVEFVVEGTLRRIGDRIRVSVRLLSIREDSIVWAEKFDEKFTDVLELEDLISGRIAKSLTPELTREEERQLQKRGTNSPAAYEAFMRGRYLANQFTNDALLKSLAAFEEAIRIDPDYALPRVGVAEFYVWSSVFGALPSHEAYPKAKAELNRALAVDDRLAEAYALASFVALLYDWDWAKAETLVKKSLEINPNYSFGHNTRAHIFASRGIAEEAMKEIKKAESLDPLSPLAKVMTSCISYQAHHFDEGTAKARQAAEMQMNFPQGFLHLGNSLTHNNGAAEAVEVLTVLTGLWENSALPKFMLCFALAADGQIEKAKEVLQHSLAIAENYFVKPYFLAMAYAAVGEIDKAFEYFSKAIEARDEWMIWFGTDIKLDVLRNDPRYLQILKQTNNPMA